MAFRAEELRITVIARERDEAGDVVQEVILPMQRTPQGEQVGMARALRGAVKDIWAWADEMAAKATTVSSPTQASGPVPAPPGRKPRS